MRAGDRLVAVAATDTLIRQKVAGLGRDEAVELSCLCAARSDMCRVVLRLWRAFFFPVLSAQRGYRWALSYQDAAIHRGNLYRFDGWTKLATSRSGVDTRTGRRGRSKVVWGWRNPETVDPADLQMLTISGCPGNEALPALISTFA